jgi:hypothetical protein
MTAVVTISGLAYGKIALINSIIFLILKCYKKFK